MVAKKLKICQVNKARIEGCLAGRHAGSSNYRAAAVARDAFLQHGRESGRKLNAPASSGRRQM